MRKKSEVTCLFLDIGGVLLSNGWDHHARKRAAIRFKLERAEMEERHQLNFETYEMGKITLIEYLERVIFHRKRPFTPTTFKKFMFAQSQAIPGMIDLMARLKARHALKIAVVSNEGRELNDFRIEAFKLGGLVDFFISSCFVQLRKPDAAIFQMALDIAHVPTRQILYLENTALFVEVAEGLGIRSILHTDRASTESALGSFGLSAPIGMATRKRSR